jgi:outer membrane protein insertion porin family
MKQKHRAVSLSTWTLVCAALSMAGQNLAFEGKTIVRIEYQPANQSIDSRDLERVQVLRTGSPLHSADVAESIERMFATGRYADIQVDAEAKAPGVAVRFITRERRFLGHVETSGKISDPPSAAQIAAASQLGLGAPLQPELLTEAQQNIQRLFTSNGLYEAKFHLELSDDPQHEQTSVRIAIEPGIRARYAPPVIRGDTKLPDSTIVRATGWRTFLIHKWKKVTDALNQKAVEGIDKKYRKVNRLTATVEIKSIDYDSETNRAKATVDIQAGPIIHLKAVDAKLSRGRLKRYVPIYEEGEVDQDLLVEGARNLRDYFQSRGYPDVDVTFRQLPPSSGEQTIEYVISTGPRQKLARVRFIGNRYFDAGTLRERMLLQPSSFWLRWGRYSEAYRKRDQQSIEALYQTNGFRSVRVTTVLDQHVQNKDSRIGITFTIAEGPQWLVENLKLQGLSETDTKTLSRHLNSAAHQPYSDLAIDLDHNLILDYCYRSGYRHATFAATSESAGANRVNLVYDIQKGDQEFVREVLVSGLKSTRPSLVQRDLKITPGDPLSLPQDRQVEQTLYDLGVFAEVDTAVQNSDGDERYKYILFDFTEAHKYTLNLGIGAEIAQLGATSNNLSAPVGGTGFTPRFSADLNRINLWGIGHSVTFQTRLSTLEQRVGINYLIPRFMNAKGRSLTYSLLYDDSRDVRTFASHREEGSVQLSQKLSKPTTAIFRFAYRRVSTSNIVIPALLVPQFLQPVRIGMFSTSLIQDRRDHATDPHSGMYNTVDIGLASSIFGSQRSFGRILVRNATYYRLSKNVVLARQTTFGAILPFRVPDGLTTYTAVPLPERFFSGGDISDRAFSENQAGPRDIGSPTGPGGTQTEATGFPLGGNALLMNNIELRFPLIGQNIGGVLFEDAGNVYSTLGNISFRYHQQNLQDFNYMVHAVGFGIRYRTPVGPLRADVSYALNPPSFAGFNGTVQQLLACNPNLPPSQLPAQCQPVVQNTGHFHFFFSIGQTF